MSKNFFDRFDRGLSHKDLISTLSNNDFEKLPIYNQDFDNSHIKNRSIEVGLIKEFINSDFCYATLKEIIGFSILNSPINDKFLPSRFNSNFWSMDILPRGVETKRIFRTFIFGRLNDQNHNLNYVASLFNKINNFHDEVILSSFNKEDKQEIFEKYKYSPQIIHYPTGGGHFDWHNHPLYPETYGICICLSKTNVDESRIRDFGCMGKGQMLFKGKDKIFSGEGQIDIGDMVIFKYDLPHCVTPCDHLQDLTIGDCGHWMAISPLLSSN